MPATLLRCVVQPSGAAAGRERRTQRASAQPHRCHAAGGHDVAQGSGATRNKGKDWGIFAGAAADRIGAVDQ